MSTRREKLKRVVFIDDNEVDNFIHLKTLEGCGLRNILTFTDTTIALQHLAQTQDVPQLIFLDINMPLMNGFEFIDELDKLKISRQEFDIIFLSSSNDIADIQKAKEKNYGDFINKPLTTEKLFALLDKDTTEKMAVTIGK